MTVRIHIPKCCNSASFGTSWTDIGVFFWSKRKFSKIPALFSTDITDLHTIETDNLYAPKALKTLTVGSRQ